MPVALSRDDEARALEAIAWITMASGALQAAAPELVLARLAARPDRLSRHLFATVGMFMTVAGGYLLVAVRLPGDRGRTALAWCAAQKLGSAAAVGIGVRQRVFSRMGLPVAAFDLASGMLALRYRARIGR